MKAVLVFNANSERADLNLALNAGKISSDLEEFYQELRRMHKYDESLTEAESAIVDKIYSRFNELFYKYIYPEE